MKKNYIILLLVAMIFFTPTVFAANQYCIDFTNGQSACIIGNGTINASNISGGGGSVYYNGTGLGLVGSTFSIIASYRLPQTCSDGQLVLWNSSSGAWDDCAAPSGGGTVTSVTRGFGFNGSGTSITTTGTLDINGSALASVCEEITGGSGLCDGTDSTGSDSQTLSYNAGTDEISISGGNTIDITEVDTDTNCTSEGACPLITYDTELDNSTIVRTGDDQKVTINWGNITSGVPAGFSDGVDNDSDTTYVNGSGLNLTGTTFSVILSYFTSNCAAITGSSDLCDGDDNAGAGSFDFNFTNGSLDGVITDSEVFAIKAGTGITVEQSDNNLTITNTVSDIDTQCDDIVCDLSDDTGYDFVDLDFTGTTGFDDNIDNDTTYTHLSNFTDDLGHLEDNTSWNKSHADTLYPSIATDSNDWDEIGDVPTNTPTNGDTANLSTSDQIYDWVASNPFSWITNSVSDLTNYYLKTEIDTQGEVQSIWGVTLMNALVNDTSPKLGGDLNVTNAYKVCFNDACTHYINETCHVWPSGGTECTT